MAPRDTRITAEKQQIPESVVERDLRRKAEANSIMCLKFTSGINGVPDRVLIGRHHDTGQPITAFVELKRFGKRPRAIQQVTIKKMLSHGATIAISDCTESNDLVLHNIFGVPLPETHTPSTKTSP